MKKPILNIEKFLLKLVVEAVLRLQVLRVRMLDNGLSIM